MRFLDIVILVCLFIIGAVVFEASAQSPPDDDEGATPAPSATPTPPPEPRAWEHRFDGAPEAPRAAPVRSREDVPQVGERVYAVPPTRPAVAIATPGRAPKSQRLETSDNIFLLPTGSTLPEDTLALGFPGQGLPDIQYGLSDRLQLGVGYGLVGFTTSARLGLIRARRVRLAGIYGAFLPTTTPKTVSGQYAGGALTSGEDAFAVHVGYFWTDLSGTFYREAPDRRYGGLGYAALELRLAPKAKFLTVLGSWSELGAPARWDELAEPDPIQIVAVVPGIRLEHDGLQFDVGVAAGRIEGDGRTESERLMLPVASLRYRF